MPSDDVEIQARQLYTERMAKLRQSDAGVINLTPFRGPSCAAAAAFEAGVLAGLGRPVMAYLNISDVGEAEYVDRVEAHVGAQRDEHGVWRDGDGCVVEDFGLPETVMLWAEARRDGTPMSVLLLDADHFKPVNDQFGHAVGDELLRHLAQRLRNAVRSSDIVCRIGGDEFLVICPRSNLHGAVRAAQKILDSQEPFLTAQAQPCWDGSLSIGIAEVDASMLHTEDLLKRADRALYEAKQKGGSRAMTS